MDNQSGIKSPEIDTKSMRGGAYPTLSKTFYFFFVFVTGWWLAGGYTDMWAHAHVAELETFFTPWHAVFYSGFFATATLFVITIFLNHRKGYPWKYSLPRVWLVSFYGMGIFMFGGIADMIWHTFLGIENNFAIIISPPHIIVSVGAMMVTMSVCRLMWSKDGNPQTTPTYILILLLAYMVLAFNYMTDYFNPFAFPYMAEGFVRSGLFAPQLGHVAIGSQASEILGFANIILFTTFFMGIVLMSIRYWRPPFGTFTVILTLSVAAITIAYTRYYWFIVVAALAGIFADVLYQNIKDLIAKNYRGFRIFAFFVPVILFSGYALVVVLTDKSLWEFPMWGGTILLSGLTGVLLSYLMFPPLVESAKETN